MPWLETRFVNIFSLTRIPFVFSREPAGLQKASGEWLWCYQVTRKGFSTSPIRVSRLSIPNHFAISVADGSSWPFVLLCHWTVPPWCDYSIAHFFAKCNIRNAQSLQNIFVKWVEKQQNDEKDLLFVLTCVIIVFVVVSQKTAAFSLAVCEGFSVSE